MWTLDLRIFCLRNPQALIFKETGSATHDHMSQMTTTKRSSSSCAAGAVPCSFDQHGLEARLQSIVLVYKELRLDAGSGTSWGQGQAQFMQRCNQFGIFAAWLGPLLVILSP